jgi:UPF0716 family protein affecting phage T7 exclusion
MKRKHSEKSASAGQVPAEPTVPEPSAQWKPVTCVAFRFLFVYLGLFVLVTQISGSMIPNLTFYYRGFGKLWPLSSVTAWTAEHVFGVEGVDGTGGGEPLFFWVQTFWVLMASVVATVVWSVVDRHRENYITLHKWFRLFIRFALAAAMLEYGMTKVIPTQFPAPSLETLVTPTGDLTLSALLWTSIGASPAYEILTGCTEVLGGILLLVPRTTLLGALVSMTAMLQVFALNMTYDIGLKLVSFHLIVLALFLIAPDVRRLADLFLQDRATNPAKHASLFETAQANRVALVLQLIFAAYLVGMYAYINVRFWEVGGGGKPKSPLYGIWNVESLSIDGEARPPYLNDYDRRWRRAIFDEPSTVIFQRTDDSFARFEAIVDSSRKTVELTKGNSKNWKANFNFDQPSPDRLILDGEMDGHRIRTELQLVNFDTFRVLNSRFRWVRPHDR